MKKIILTAIMMAFVLTSCNQKNKEAETNNSINTEETAALYACPMHPEIQGKKGDTCSECGMELTEPVIKESTTHVMDSVHSMENPK